MKIKFKKLPDGFKVRNGQVVEVKQTGGSTGDQNNYGLVTTPKDHIADDELNVKYSMAPVPKDEANIEAEKGETVLTDLNGDGKFGLYDIQGKRHARGGTPLFLPEQSFVFSDFNKMKFTKEEMEQMGVESKKRLTPAKISKKFSINEFYASLKDPYADEIQANTADLMLEKNKMQLSKLAFLQESKKDFEEGVPVSSFPFLVEQGQDPIAYMQEVENINKQKAEEKFISSLPPEQQMQIAALQQYMAQVDQQKQGQQEEALQQGMLPPAQDQGMQMPPEMQGMQQGMPPQGQGMMPPPPDMNPQQMAQMGYEIQDMGESNAYDMPYAQRGSETKEELTWEDIPGDYTNEEKKWLFDVSRVETEGNIEDQKKWLKGELWASLIFEDSERGDKWRKSTIKDNTLAHNSELIFHNLWKRGYNVHDDNIISYVYNIAKGDNYNKFIGEDLVGLEEEIYEATGQRPKGNTSTTNQSPQTDGNIELIKSILNLPNAANIPDNIKKVMLENANRLDPNVIEYMTNELADANDPSKAAYKNRATRRAVSGLIQGFQNKMLGPWQTGNDADRTFKQVYKPGDWNDPAFINAIKNYEETGKFTEFNSNQATTEEAEEFLDDPERELATAKKAVQGPGKEFRPSDVTDDYPFAYQPNRKWDEEFDSDKKIFGDNEELKKTYLKTEETFGDPNSAASQALITKFREGIENNDYFGRNVTKSEKQKLRDLSDRDIIKYFLMMQKRNLGAYAHELAGGQSISDYDQTGDRALGTDPELEKLFIKMGLGNQTSGPGGIAQQLSYLAYRDLLKSRDDGSLDEETSERLKPFGVRQVGKKDEDYGIDPEKDISRAEGYLTNTTTGQNVSYKFDEIPTATEYIEPVIPDAEEADDPDDPINIKPNELKVPYNPNDPRFWLQDLLKLNAIASRKRKKFYPWQPAVEDIDIDWVLEDPTRAIAATNEQMNLMAQGLGTFGGPQSFNSRMANVQGKTAANIANITAGVHNRNINTVNRGLAQQAQYDHLIDKENRIRKTKLYDDTMKVEQNALIEENFDREQYADSLASAYTNMANTYNMNTLYDNFNVDPTTGGMMYFTNPTALDPSPNYQSSKMNLYKQRRKQFMIDNNRDWNQWEAKMLMGEEDDQPMNNYQREMFNKQNPGFIQGYDYTNTGQRGKEVRKLLPFFVGHVGI